MVVIHESERGSLVLEGEEIRDVSKRILIGPQDGFSGYLRQFTLGPGGHTPFHSHNWYHAVYVLEGEGSLRLESGEQPLRQGSVAFVEADCQHAFHNRGASAMRFLCLVPEKGDAY